MRRFQPTSSELDPNVQLTRITGPIQEDLARVERAIAASLRTENLFIRQMVEYLAHGSGKRLRPAMAILSAKAFGEVGEPVIALAASIEMLHVATLIHDDIIDNSQVRRKQKTLNFKWGNEISVLMGDYVFASSFYLMAQNLPKDVLETLSDTTNIICRGEISETFHRFNPDLTEDQYFEVVREKTASLIAAACQTGAMLAGADGKIVDALYRFGLGIGMAFQVIDDALDYEGQKDLVGKPVLTDFKEGKLTLPVLHLMKACKPAEHKKIRALILKKVKTAADLRGLTGLLAKYGSVEYSRKRAEGFATEATQALAVLNGNPLKKDLLQFAEFFVRRDY